MNSLVRTQGVAAAYQLGKEHGQQPALLIADGMLGETFPHWTDREIQAYIKGRNEGINDGRNQLSHTSPASAGPS